MYIRLTGATMSDKRHVLFSSRLKERIARHGLCRLSEDCIRYEYFSALRETEGRAAADLLLEYEHPNPAYQQRGRRKIDCVIMNGGGRPEEAIEFKYFIERKDYHRPEAAGALFADCYRLLDTGIPRKTIVLVSTRFMTGYIEKPSNKLSFLFTGKDNCEKIPGEFYKQMCDTFFQAIRKSTYDGFKPFAFELKHIFFERTGDYVIAVFRLNKE
jgi:hypothetical protein